MFCGHGKRVTRDKIESRKLYAKKGGWGERDRPTPMLKPLLVSVALAILYFLASV